MALYDVVRPDGEFDVIQMTQRGVDESSEGGVVLAESYDTQLLLQEQSVFGGKGNPVLQAKAKPVFSFVGPALRDSECVCECVCACVRACVRV